MLSLYIHIPFCYHKCWYCSFNVIPLNALATITWGIKSIKEQEESIQHINLSPIITNYLEALHRQIDDLAIKLGNQEIRTIYFGGGTPSIIGSDNISKIIDHISSIRSIEYLEELSIEINPEPVNQMLDLISTISNRYKHFHRVRFSIGIQSFDNEVLEESGRQYNFQSCVDFLRKLTDIKMEHNIFNFDFIAFGKFNQTRKGDIQLRDPVRLDFFQRFAESGFADSFSLYTLELFEWSQRFNEQIAKHSHKKAWYGLKRYGSDDDVYAEFEILKEILLETGYQRYEISNYSRAGANSIHNRIYRSMDERLWLGTGATSHLKVNNLKKLVVTNSEIVGWHISIVSDLKRFSEWKWIDEKKSEFLTENDFLKEKFIMGMRTMDGVIIDEDKKKNKMMTYLLQSNKTEISHTKPQHTIGKITNILVSNREEKVIRFEEQGFCEYDGIKLRLTDTGMDLYNSIIVELLA